MKINWTSNTTYIIGLVILSPKTTYLLVLFSFHTVHKIVNQIVTNSIRLLLQEILNKVLLSNVGAIQVITTVTAATTNIYVVICSLIKVQLPYQQLDQTQAKFVYSVFWIKSEPIHKKITLVDRSVVHLRAFPTTRTEKPWLMPSAWWKIMGKMIPG